MRRFISTRMFAIRTGYWISRSNFQSALYMSEDQQSKGRLIYFQSVTNCFEYIKVGF